MRQSEYRKCIYAISEIVEELSHGFVGVKPTPNTDWFGYLCGYCRALNEFAENGPYADYSLPYKVFNMKESDEDFHEGFVTALTLAIQKYTEVRDES